MIEAAKRIPPGGGFRIPGTNLTPYRREAPTMRRELVWVEQEGCQGWACSKCAWEFNPSGLPTGKTIAEMKQNYERQRDGEFTSHLCAEHPRVQRSNSTRQLQLK